MKTQHFEVCEPVELHLPHAGKLGLCGGIQQSACVMESDNIVLFLFYFTCSSLEMACHYSAMCALLDLTAQGKFLGCQCRWSLFLSLFLTRLLSLIFPISYTHAVFFCGRCCNSRQNQISCSFHLSSLCTRVLPI